MIKLTADQIQTAYRKLPQDIRDAYFSEDVTEKIEALGQKHRLHIDQLGELSNQISLILLGLAKPGDFKMAVMNQLKIDQTTTDNLTTDINNQIFLPIRESLQKLSSSPDQSPINTSNQPPTTETKTITPETTNVFEAKMEKMFTLPKEQVDLPEIKAWEEDPYMEKPE